MTQIDKLLEEGLITQREYQELEEMELANILLELAKQGNPTEYPPGSLGAQLYEAYFPDSR